MSCGLFFFFFFQAEDGIRYLIVTGVQTCALPIFASRLAGNRFDGRVRWQRVIKRLVDGLLTLSRPSCPSGHGPTSTYSKNSLYLRPQQDSNLRTRLRRPLLYPLSYGGTRTDDPAERTLAEPQQAYQSQGSAGHVL